MTASRGVRPSARARSSKRSGSERRKELTRVETIPRAPCDRVKTYVSGPRNPSRLGAPAGTPSKSPGCAKRASSSAFVARPFAGDEVEDLVGRQALGNRHPVGDDLPLDQGPEDLLGRLRPLEAVFARLQALPAEDDPQHGVGQVPAPDDPFPLERLQDRAGRGPGGDLDDGRVAGVALVRAPDAGGAPAATASGPGGDQGGEPPGPPPEAPAHAALPPGARGEPVAEDRRRPPRRRGPPGGGPGSSRPRGAPPPPRRRSAPRRGARPGGRRPPPASWRSSAP